MCIGGITLINPSLQQSCKTCSVGYNWTISVNSSLAKGGEFNGESFPDEYFLEHNTTAIGTWAIIEKVPYISASSFAIALNPDLVLGVLLTMMSLLWIS